MFEHVNHHSQQISSCHLPSAIPCQLQNVSDQGTTRRHLSSLPQTLHCELYQSLTPSENALN